MTPQPTRTGPEIWARFRHKKEEEKLRRRNYDLEKQREKAALVASNMQTKLGEVPTVAASVGPC